MPPLSAYAVFIATAVAILLVPGSAVLYVVTRSIEMGRVGGSGLGVLAAVWSPSAAK